MSDDEARRVSFLITIDTEGDNLWARPREITTRNAEFLPRFQSLCERYGLKPTWLTNYEMACSPVFAEFARDVIRRGAGEVGMHLHAWNSPPIVPLTDDDFRYHPFLIEYPDEVLRAKVTYLTRFLEDRFQIPIRSHRAGRWAFDARYAAVLAELGYTSDCSVTPTISWRRTRGAPGGEGGSNYSEFPRFPYRLDLEHIHREGASGLLEVPMTIRRAYPWAARWIPDSLKLGVLRRLDRARLWLRPRGTNLGDMLRLVRAGIDEGWPHLEFMLHSSEFMPGGNQTFRTDDEIDRLYHDVEVLFDRVSGSCRGLTMTEFVHAFESGYPRRADA